MKRFRKLASAALALVMAVGLSVPVFAAETEINYDVYQIFTGNFGSNPEGDGNVLSDIKAGQNYKGDTEVGHLVPDAVIEDLHDKMNMDAPELAKYIADTYVDTTAGAYKTVSGAFGEDVTVSGVTPGYYMVQQSNVPAGQTAATFTVTATGDSFTFSPKTVGAPTVEKKVEGESKNGAAIGDELEYTITTVVPSNVKSYDKYYIGLADTMSAGLTLKDGSIAVTLNGVDVTNKFYVNSSVDEAGVTTIKVAAWLSDAEPNAAYVLTYTATVNTAAATGKDPNTNKVVLTYSNNPADESKPWNDSTTPPTEPENPGTIEGVEGETETYVTGLTLTYFRGKTAEDKADLGRRLAGAKFELSGDALNQIVEVVTDFAEDANGDYYKLKNGTYTTVEPTDATAVQYEGGMDAVTYAPVVTVATATGEKSTIGAYTNGEGQIVFTGMGAGTYTLHQVSAAAGMKTHPDETFTISFDTENLFSDDHEGITEENEWFFIDISGESGLLLPETGGMGVYVLYAVGIALFAAAAGMMVLKGRKRSEG